LTGDDGLDRAVAIVGVGGVFPGAANASEFWTNLLTQTDCIRELPPERFDADVFYDPDPEAEDKSYCRVGGVVERIPLEPHDLRLPPADARLVDRLQLLAFAAARDALRDAGYDRRPFDRSRTAVILGQSSSRTEAERTTSWRVQHRLVEAVAQRRLRAAGLDDGVADGLLEELREQLRDPLEPLGPNTLVGMLPNVAAGRIASAFDLHGPNYVVDAACASSLAALDEAAQGLLDGEFDVALTGGTWGDLDPVILVAFSKYRGLSRTRCRSFDAAADGFVIGEGAGVFVVKRLADALADDDRIYAVVRGIGGSSDGRWRSMAAPNPRTQALAIRLALDSAGYGADTLQFVETHGAGTSVGDRSEVEGLRQAFDGELREDQRIYLGAVKSHVGHLFGAAGAAGLMSTVLGLHHEVLPPVFGFEQPNPAIPWAELPFDVVGEPTIWPANVDGLPRRAGVSALGFGGVNYHVALEGFDAAFHDRSPRRRPRTREGREPIAIVGLASVLPDADTADAFWTNLVERRYSIEPLPDDRFEGDRSLFVDRAGKLVDASYTDLGSTVEPPELDPSLFPMPQATLERLDPEQRLFLACAAEALADAAYSERAYDRARVAVIAADSIGCRQTVWNACLRLNALRAERVVAGSAALGRVGLEPEARTTLAAEIRGDLVRGRPALTEDSALANALQLAAARLTKVFDWQGPHMIVDAACASGLGALTLAVNGLRADRFDLVVTGSSSGSLLPAGVAIFAQTTALSATGSRPLSASADGLVLGEGTVVFVLKRLSDALDHGDRVYSVIRGVGASSDGRGRALMAPNPDGQELAIARAWEDAGLDPSTVQFVECHATATRLGDDVELESMWRLFGGANGRRIGVGSVKSQIGHLGGGAAGPALLKTVLGLHHRTLPPTVLDGEPIDGLNGDGPFDAVTEAAPWPENTPGEPRRAAVNSFGFGGTNFHAVLEEFDPAYHRRLLARPAPAPAAALRLPRDAVVFLFPGQGSWYPDMVRELYDQHEIVRETFEEADGVLRALVGATLEEVLFTRPDQSARDVEARLRDGELAQPALVAASVALDRLLRSLGAVPQVVGGHSLGDYAALVSAGVMTLADALTAAHGRARSLREVAEQTDAGRMAAVLAGEHEVRRVLEGVDGYVAVANLNSPSQTVVSGETDAVGAALEAFQQEGIDFRELPIAAAFHSQLARPAQTLLAKTLAEIPFAPPQLPCLSSVTGEPVDGDPATMRELLVGQLCAPVDFVGVVRRLHEAGARRFVEVGPKRVLTPFVDEILEGAEHVAVAVDRRDATAEQVARAVEAARGQRREVKPARVATPARAAPVGDEIEAAVLAVVSELTGYEPELLGLDVELEADLGIDSIKQAQILARLGEQFGLELDPQEFRPSDFPTLRHVIDFARAQAPARRGEEAPRPKAPPRPLERFVVERRGAPLSAEQANLEIGPGWRVLVVAPDDALQGELERRGAHVAAPGEPIDGVIYIHEGGDAAKKALALLQDHLDTLRGRGFFAVAGPPGPDAAAVAGLLASAAKELPGVLFKAIELGGEPAATIIAELEQGGRRVEVAWTAGERSVPHIVRRPLDPRPLELDESCVVLAIGGGRGITAELVRRLVEAASPTVVIWGSRTVDVRDADAVEAGVRAILAEHGRLDGVIFGAGTIEDKLLEDKTSDSFDRVFDVKAKGVQNVVRALDGVEPRFFVALTSVAGVFGNRGQADYAAANAFVDRLVATEAQRRRGRWFTTAWGPWAEVGLAARSGVVELAAAAGIEPIEPAEGAAAFELELATGEGTTILLTRGLGRLDRDGVVALFDSIERDGASLLATRTFSLDRDPWLADHTLAGVVTLPGVVGVELLVQAAAELVADARFVGLEGLRLHRAVRLHRGDPVTVHVRAQRDDAPGLTRVRTSLATIFTGPDGVPRETLHYEASVELGQPPAPPERPAPLAAAEAPTSGEIYAPGGPLPHGPAFQPLAGIRVDDSAAVGELAADRPLVAAARTAPFAREAAWQTAGLHAITRHGIVALPVGCDRVEHFGAPPPGVALRAEARLCAVCGDEVEYDIDLVGDDGRVYDRTSGYRAARLPSGT
jgi:acyl transferase domain-containing protein/acyl carrier protein